MQQERGEHQQVPLPPRRVPVPRPGDHDHRLGQQRERDCDGDDEPRAPPAVEAEVAGRGDDVEGDARRGERRAASRRAAPAPAGCRAAAARRARRAPTARARRRAPRARAVRAAAHAWPRARQSSSDETAANAEATTSPTGVASSKPAFLPSRTPGVASACSPRKPALDRHASETRNSRASRRRRPALLTAQPSPTLAAAASSTSQKCAGWLSQIRSIDGRQSRIAKIAERHRDRGHPEADLAAAAAPRQRARRRRPSDVYQREVAADGGRYSHS